MPHENLIYAVNAHQLSNNEQEDIIILICRNRQKSHYSLPTTEPNSITVFFSSPTP